MVRIIAFHFAIGLMIGIAAVCTGCSKSNSDPSKPIVNQEELLLNKYKDAITRALNGVVTIARNEAPSGFWEKHWDDTEKKRAFLNKIHQIDLTDCPQDFQVAFVEWLRALEVAINRTSKYKGWNGIFNGTAALLSGEWSASEPNSVENQVAAQIGKAFDNMELVALKYRVNNPLKQLFK